MLNLELSASQAVAEQLKAHQFIERFLLDKGTELDHQFAAIHRGLAQSEAFYWARNTADAAMKASTTIPSEGTFENPGFGPGLHMFWWYFEEPLDFQTTRNEDERLSAILISATSESMAANCFVKPLTSIGRSMIPDCLVATASVSLYFDQTFDQIYATMRRKYREVYGPGGKWYKMETRAEVNNELLGEEIFMAVGERLVKFLAAAHAWIRQRIAVESPGHVERHRRKEFERKLGRRPEVRIVQLRRTDYKKKDDAEATEGEKRQYAVRWLVDGHWRNARVGPGRAERRLTWVSPHLAGPENAPFQAKQKIYVVSK